MSEATSNPKYQALQFAAQHIGESPADVVKRATAYYSFLSGVATATASQPATSAKGDSSATGTSGKGNTNAAGKSAGAAANKPAAGAANKPAGAAAGKPAAGANKPAATKQNVGAGGFPADDTKAPGAKNDFAAMCKKLRAVMQDTTNGGKAEASRILAEDGDGADSVRTLDPKFYDAVVEACENVLNPGDAGDGETGDGEADSDLGL